MTHIRLRSRCDLPEDSAGVSQIIYGGKEDECASGVFRASSTSDTPLINETGAKQESVESLSCLNELIPLLQGNWKATSGSGNQSIRFCSCSSDESYCNCPFPAKFLVAECTNLHKSYTVGFAKGDTACAKDGDTYKIFRSAIAANVAFSVSFKNQNSIFLHFNYEPSELRILSKEDEFTFDFFRSSP